MQQTHRLRLLSYNIHVGLPSNRYSDYVIGHWRHRMSYLHRLRNLKKIAEVIKAYDFVALQEVDFGSLRSGFVNQVDYLATHAEFPFWHQQINRNLGRIAKHGNGLLSRVPIHHIHNHRLPGTIPGRGAIEVRLGDEADPLVIILLHLALGKRSRDRQLNYIAGLVDGLAHVVLMGDMNCSVNNLLTNSPLRYTNMIPAQMVQQTYPSWRPQRDLDHIWVTPNLQVANIEVLPYVYSDHLPIALELVLPLINKDPHEQGSLLENA